MEVGDQDAADGKVKGKYKGIFQFCFKSQNSLIHFFFSLISDSRMLKYSAKSNFKNQINSFLNSPIKKGFQ